MSRPELLYIRLRSPKSLARFLPSLTSVKESKLSKHTIVDESLKYHELQKTKLDDLQKTVDVLKAEKEALLTELSGWRECLDVQPEQPVLAELLGATTAGSNAIPIGTHDPNLLFDANTAEPIAALGVSSVPSATYGMLTGPIPTPPSHSQLLDNFVQEAPNMRFRDESNMENLPRASQYPIQDNTLNGHSQHSLWQQQEIPHMQQPLWTQQSHQEVPFDFQHHRF